MDNNWIKCILAGRSMGTSSESLISLNISGKSTVTSQKAGNTFNPSGYSFKTVNNMGKEQIISTSDSSLEFYTDDKYSSKILEENTTIIYVKYKNVSNTINLAADGVIIEKQELPIELNGKKWYLKADYCPTYNGTEQLVNYTVAGFSKINTKESQISATNVHQQGYKLVITEIAKGWSLPSGYDKQEVYWNIRPAEASIDLQGISTLQVSNGKIVINDKVKATTATTFSESITVIVTGAQGFILPISIIDSASSNITAAQLTENNKKLVLTLKSTVINTLDCALGSIRFTSPNFVYSFKVNGSDVTSSNNQITFVGNLLTTGIITDDWETIINNPDNYNLGDIKILETKEGYEIAGTGKWQMQLVDKTDNILTFYSTNISNEQTSDYKILNSVTEDYFIDLNVNVITTASFINNGNEITARSKFWLGTEYQIKSNSSNAPGMKKFQYISEPQNNFKLIQPGEYYLAESNIQQSPSDRHIATLDTNGIVSYPISPYAHIRLGFKIAKDTTASIPTITEGATLKDLSNFISAKANNATTATYDSKGFIPGSRFLFPESFQLSDGTILKGVVYIAAIDKTNNIVTLQSSYLKSGDNIYLIDTDSIFEKFQYQQNYKGSDLEVIYSNMQVLNTPNLIQTNTIATQNYVYTSQSPVNKASVTVGACYLPSAAECGITTATLKGVTYDIPVLGTKTSYPTDISGIKTMFDISNSPSYWTRIRDNIIYSGGNNSAYVLCGINKGILIPAGWEDANGKDLGSSQRESRYYKIALTPRFRIGG